MPQSQEVYTQQEVEQIRKEHKLDTDKMYSNFMKVLDEKEQQIKEQTAVIETMRKYNEELLNKQKALIERVGNRMY